MTLTLYTLLMPRFPREEEQEIARKYQLPLANRMPKFGGWRAWTGGLGFLAVVFTTWAISRAETLADVHRIITTLASICGGGAIVTGFLWKLLGENSLTVIKMKDELILELRRSHSEELHAIQRDVDLLREELKQIKELNLALQRHNLDLTGERDDLLRVRDSLDASLATAQTEARVSHNKACQLEEMLDLARTKITLLEHPHHT